MENLREITVSETISVRHPVLRAGKSLESCHFDGDELPSTKHYGYFDGENLVGIISVFETKSTSFSDENQFQIRGMAVLESHQKTGIGEQLVHFAESEIRKKNGVTIWFNARTAAVGFYTKLNYTVKGSEFDIPDVGPHYLMFKNLN